MTLCSLSSEIEILEDERGSMILWGKCGALGDRISPLTRIDPNSGATQHQRHRAKRGDAGVSDDGADGEVLLNHNSSRALRFTAQHTGQEPFTVYYSRGNPAKRLLLFAKNDRFEPHSTFDNYA